MCPAPDTYTPPPDGDLPVVHLDDHFIALDKPSGLLSVPGKGQALADCLEARVQARHPAALTVHRLDRDTSGLVVMAMTPQAQRHLGLQFERRKLAKTYIAIVSGVIAARRRRDRPAADCRLAQPARCRRCVTKPASPRSPAGVCLSGGRIQPAYSLSRTPGAHTSCGCTCASLVIPSSAIRFMAMQYPRRG
jgi:23S rRNA-/tRNA-specific pseudouridylate synthase